MRCGSLDSSLGAAAKHWSRRENEEKADHNTQSRGLNTAPHWAGGRGQTGLLGSALKASGQRLRALAPALALSLPCGVANAQPLDLANLRSEYLPPTSLGSSPPASDMPWADASDVQVSTYSASLNLPIPLGDSTVFAPGFSYRLDSLSFSHESPAERELGLHALEVPLTLIHLLSEDWMVLAQASWAIAGDLHEFESRALRASSLVLVSRQFSHRFVLGVGGAAMYEFGSLLPVPVVYTRWEPVAGVTVDAFLPVQLEAKVALGSRFEVGAFGDVEGNSYSISDPRVRRTWPCVGATNDPATVADESRRDGAECIDHVGYSVATAGPTFGVRLVDSLWLTLYAGHTFFRRFEQMNKEDARVAGGTQTLPDVFFARVGLTWRLPDGDEAADAAPKAQL